MKTNSASRMAVPIHALVFLGLLIVGNEAEGQTILTPRPEFSITPPAVLQYQTNNEMMVFAPPESVTHPQKPLFSWGPVDFRPHVFYRFVHATGLPALETNHVEATVQEFSPGLLLSIGNHWSLDYTPTWRFYSSSEFKDTLDHSVRLIGGTTYEDWTVGFLQSYDATSEPLVETGMQTEQEAFRTALDASYQINSKMSLDLGLNQNIILADEFQSTREWSTLDWLNYQFWNRLDAGFGLGFGYADVDMGADMTYEQFQGRVNWRATDKLSVQVHGGGEVRQFLSGGADDVVNPIAGAEIQYQPFEVTKLSLGVNRVVAVSLVTSGAQSQLTERTDVTGHLNQRLFEQVYLDLAGGYHKVTYVMADTSATGREDDYYTFSARVGCPFLKRGMAAVFYQYSDVSSNTEGYTYSSSQVGFEIGYRF